jgi:hypothetical protein
MKMLQFFLRKMTDEKVRLGGSMKKSFASAVEHVALCDSLG